MKRTTDLTKLSSILLGAGSLLVATPSFAKSCAELKLKSAEKCEDLSAQLNVSKCGDELVGEPTIKCSGNKAKIEFTGKKNRYLARVKASDGAWGASGWSQSGAVDVQALAQAADAATPVASSAAAPTVEAPAAAPAAASSRWSFSANFDAYYSVNFNQPGIATPVSNTAPFVRPAENQLHYYDFYNRQLGLNLVEFTPKYSGDQVSFFADLDFGQMADWNAAYTTAPLVIDEVSKHIGQAVISYAPNAAPGLIIEFGKLYSHVGLEVIKSKDNWNYSRSVTFGYGSPFWHTGIHVGYALVPSRLTANVYLYNGVNNLNATTKVPTLGAQLKYTPSDTTTLIYNYLGGPQQPGNVSNMRQYHEANATFNLASNLSLGLEFLAGSEQNVASVSKATWTGFTAAAKWQYSEKSYLSPRYEIFKDNHGYMTGAKRTINTYTLTHSTKLTDIMEARLEGRWDHTNDTGLLFKSSGAGTNDQVSALVGVMVTMQ